MSLDYVVMKNKYIVFCMSRIHASRSCTDTDLVYLIKEMRG